MTKLIGWFFLLLAIPLGFFAFKRSVDKCVSRSWPVTQAQVLGADMYKRSRSGDWCLRLRYRYVIDGEAFSSRKLASSFMSNAGCDQDKSVIDARRERLQPGAALRVRYDPADPGRSLVYLEDLDFSDYFFNGLALVLFASGIKALRDAAALRRQQAAFSG